MIWHIFKKDWKLTWPLVAIVVAIYALNTWIWLILGHFGEPSHLRRIASVLPILVYLGSSLAGPCLSALFRGQAALPAA
jgi:hypothetical protein